MTLDEVLERAQATAEAVWRALRDDGRLREGAEVPRMDLPRSYRETLASALAAGTPERVELVGRYYGEILPEQHARQACDAEGIAATLLHTPLDWGRLPRLAGALARLRDLLPGDLHPLAAEAGSASVSESVSESASGSESESVSESESESESVSVSESASDATSPPGFVARGVPPRGTSLWDVFSEACFGAFMPMLYTSAPDLASYQRELAAGADLHTLIDRRLAGPVLHELCHLGRHRDALLPPILDESIAAWLGVQALPDIASPPPGEDVGMVGASGFARIGQALVRAFGVEPVLASHAGLAPWSDAIPQAVRDELEDHGRWLWRRSGNLSFLDGYDDPAVWWSLILHRGAPEHLEAADPLDVAMLEAGLRALCVHEWTTPEGAWRATSHSSTGEVRVELARGVMTGRGGRQYPLPPRFWGPHDALVLADVPWAEIPAVAEAAARTLDGDVVACDPWRRSS